MSQKEGQELADKLKCQYFEVSAKDGTNVDLVFHTLIQSIVDTIEKDPVKYFQSFPRLANKLGKKELIVEPPVLN